MHNLIALNQELTKVLLRVREMAVPIMFDNRQNALLRLYLSKCKMRFCTQPNSVKDVKQ